MTASLCMCCHTCLRLGHGRATGTWGSMLFPSRAFVTSWFLPAVEPGLFRWDQERAQQTCLLAPQHPPRSLLPPPALTEQMPDTRRSSELAAFSSTMRIETTHRLPALSWWGSEGLLGHFADTESLHTEMLFLPRSPGPR